MFLSDETSGFAMDRGDTRAGGDQRSAFPGNSEVLGLLALSLTLSDLLQLLVVLHICLAYELDLASHTEVVSAGQKSSERMAGVACGILGDLGMLLEGPDRPAG